MIRVSMRMRLCALALAGAVAPSGCTVFGTDLEPVASYTLSPPERLDVSWNGGHCCLLEVRTPLPAPGFATTRMVYQRSEYQYEAFAYSQWVDTLPGLVRASMIEGLAGIGLFSDVVAAPSPEAPDYRIETRDLLVLQRFDGERSEVEVSLRARVVDAEERLLLGVRQFAATVPARSADPQGGVVAANEALADVLNQLARYLVEVIGGRSGAASPEDTSARNAA